MKMRAALLGALLVALAGPATAQNFNQFFGFGDSTTDTGWYTGATTGPHSTGITSFDEEIAAALAAGGNAHFTGPGPGNAQILAGFFGLSANSASTPGGTNYAIGGSLDKLVPPGYYYPTSTGNLYPNPLLPGTATQIDNYLASVDGHVNPDALYLISSGSGRGLISSTQPYPDGRKLDEGEVVRRKLIVAGCNTPALFDLVEEPLHQVASAVKVRAEAERLLPVPSRWDICPSAVLADKCFDPIGVIAAISQQHRPRFQTGQEFGDKSVVVRFARREGEPDRQAIGVDHRMNLAGETAARPAHGLRLAACDASRVLMHSHNGRVDHLDGGVMSSTHCVHDPAPDASAAPANEAIVAGGIGAEILRQITPGCPRSQDPEDAIQDTAVVHTGHAAWLVRQHRLDGSPFFVGEFVAHDSKPRFGSLNHSPVVGLNSVSEAQDMSAFGGKADLFCSSRGIPGLDPFRASAAGLMWINGA